MAEDRSGSLFSYLSSLGRAEVALVQHDALGALRWFDKSLELYPRSTVGLDIVVLK